MKRKCWRLDKPCHYRYFPYFPRQTQDLGFSAGSAYCRLVNMKVVHGDVPFCPWDLQTEDLTIEMKESGLLKIKQEQWGKILSSIGNARRIMILKRLPNPECPVCGIRHRLDKTRQKCEPFRHWACDQCDKSFFGSETGEDNGKKVCPGCGASPEQWIEITEMLDAGERTPESGRQKPPCFYCGKRHRKAGAFSDCAAKNHTQAMKAVV